MVWQLRHVQTILFLAMNTHPALFAALGLHSTTTVLATLSPDRTHSKPIRFPTTAEDLVAQVGLLGRTGSVRHARLNTQRKVLETLWRMWLRNAEYDPKFFFTNPTQTARNSGPASAKAPIIP
jgi:hypothetical protein